MDNKQGEEDEFQGSSPNPDGFFPDLQNSDACSVAVAVRVRPLVGRELSDGNKRLCINEPDNTGQKNKIMIGTKSFNFDRVYWDTDSQEYIFDTCTKNLVLGCFHGFNATILAYGQTGSGKTHTMGTGCTLGVPFDTVGIVPRVFKFIFDELEMRKQGADYSEFKIKIAFLELYKEELHDLLDPASMMRDRITGKPAKELTIREEKNIISVRGLKEIEVSNQDECIRLLNTGINHRVTSSTDMNSQSSRSHAIFTISIEQKIVREIPEEDQKESKDGEKAAQVTEEISSKFHFVDLAGSERIKKTGATGQLMKEGISINAGLLCLGQVISALTDDKKLSGHIPYRDSKLTRILQDSLGGNSRTTMIACVSPAETNIDESLSTIKYASRARNIKNKPVVNRDPNSQLIESLRTQITQLQFEVREYVIIVQKGGLEMPAGFQEKLEAKKIEPVKKLTAPVAQGLGGANPQEVKELKIKVSHKEREIRELTQQLSNQKLIIDKKDKQIQELESEKDQATMKSEAMAESLKTNNIEFDNKQFEAKTQSKDVAQKSGLVDQYKVKLQKMQKEVDHKIREIQDRDQKYTALKQASDRNDKILKNKMDEIQQLKKQLQSGGATIATSTKRNQIEALPKKHDFKSMRAQKKEKQQNSFEDFNQKFLTDLYSQMDEMFQKKDEDGKVVDGPIGEDQEAKVDGELKEEASLNESQITQSAEDKEQAEKEKILNGVRKMAISMQSDIKDLLKNEWEGTINTLETEKKKAENEKKENLANAKNDTKKMAAIEKEHNSKMESLNSQVRKLEKDKEKKQESVQKQIAAQEMRIKALEADLVKQKKKKDEIESAKKLDENRFFKFKKDVKTDLETEKKKLKDKDTAMNKLKQDFKKVDQLAQQKISQLRGIQKRAAEERQKKLEQQEKEAESKGIDIDLIKEWIHSNTEAMLKNKELQEYLEKQTEKKSKIEDEMLESGDRMTEILIEKEKLEFEQEEIEAQPEDQKDEGRLLEIGDLCKEADMEITALTDSLDDLEETLEFIQSKINQISEEIEAFDYDSVTPLSFHALQSIESAKLTLQTFFQVVLDLNIYKRDLEMKCIEQDENVINLTANLKTQEARVQYMIQNGGQDGYATALSKQQAIQSVIKQVDGFVDNRDVEHLNLNPTEQTNLTKLSLSKIVNNLKKQITEMGVKNQSITLKLDQALKQKEIYKSRYDELKTQQKNKDFMQQPRSQKYQGVGSKLNSHEQQNTNQPNFGGPAPGRSMSFKDRQKQKKEMQEQQANGGQQMQRKPPIPQVSLADRRRNKKPMLDEEQTDASQLDQLKLDANNLGKSNQLEEINEDVDAEDEEIQNQQKRNINNLTTINEESEEAGLTRNETMRSSQQPQGQNTSGLLNMTNGLEPDQNYSQMFMNSANKMDESQAIQEEWCSENFLDLVNAEQSKLVDYHFLASKMMCLFENFDVIEIDLVTKAQKLYNLQEIENFEISEEVEEDKVISFALEKDIQLVGVSCVDRVHIFEYTEEDDIMSHVACIDKANITEVLFVNYSLTLVQQTDEGFKFYLFDMENHEIKGEYAIAKPSPESQLQVVGGSDCIYFAIGSQIGKVESPDNTTFQEVYKIESGHTDQILDITLTDLGQIITTSKDGALRFFNMTNGLEINEPMEEMECDFMAAHGLHLITRVGRGEERMILVWRLTPNGDQVVEENPMFDLELSPEDKNLADSATKFIMKGGPVVNADNNGSVDTEPIFMMYAKEAQARFNFITQKHVKF